MWKKSFLSLLLESLSFVFSLSRKRNSAILPTIEAVPKMSPPSLLPKNPDPDKVLYFPSALLQGGEVTLSVSSLVLLWEALERGDHSLCDAFGIAPELVAVVLRNVGFPGNPIPDRPSLPLLPSKG